MGKQINFYMSENVQANFIEYLNQNQFEFLNSNSYSIEDPSLSNFFMMYLYKSDYGKIIIKDDNSNVIDTIKTPVIQFCKTVIKKEQKKVLRGRLWISDRYYDEEGILIKKAEIFVDDYQMLTKWIKKNVPYQEIKKGECFVKEYVNDDLIKLQVNGFILTI